MTKSRKSKISLEEAQDIINTRSGRLLVVEYYHYGYNPNGKGAKDKTHYYRCLCDCGKELITRRTNLKKKDVLSCGCLKVEVLHKRSLDRIAAGNPSQLAHLYGTNKNNAIYRGIEFHLTREQHKSLILDKCHYCGVLDSNLCKVKDLYGELAYNGIDRMDSNKGYEIDNVVTCCYICNRAKMDMSYSNFKEYILRITKFNSGEI